MMRLAEIVNSQWFGLVVDKINYFVHRFISKNGQDWPENLIQHQLRILVWIQDNRGLDVLFAFVYLATIHKLAASGVNQFGESCNVDIVDDFALFVRAIWLFTPEMLDALDHRCDKFAYDSLIHE
jgi:hypothetical protein